MFTLFFSVTSHVWFVHLLVGMGAPDVLERCRFFCEISVPVGGPGLVHGVAALFVNLTSAVWYGSWFVYCEWVVGAALVFAARERHYRVLQETVSGGELLSGVVFCWEWTPIFL